MSKWEVAVTRRLPEAGMDMLRGSCHARLWDEDRPIPHDRLCALAEGADGIVCVLTDPVDAAVMEAAGPKLKVISTMAVGYDNIDVAEASRRGIVVGNTPGVLTEATADLTWALILSLGRRIVEGDRMVREGRFNGWGPTLLVGADFKGRTLGIVGMGRIGTAVAKRAVGFGMKILYHARHRLAPELEAAVPAHFEKLGDLLQKSDFVSLHCPLNKESFHLIGGSEIDLMKPTAYLINVARGPVVDEAALTAVLKAGRLAGAAFDVYENEPRLSPGLAELDNVVLAPHFGSASIETRNKMAVMAAQNLIAGLRGDVPPWCLNPEVRPITEG
ncbi:MAG TPA: D-glycerate dehydrogenase [bacterium]|nr:D-glycerate dehydrogenase [bacterium]